MTDANKDNKPFFPLVECHSDAHLDASLPQWEGKTGLGIYPDGMMEHDYDVSFLTRQAQGTRP